MPEAALVPEQLEPIECPEGYFLSDTDKCVPDPLTELGELIGPPPECPPELGLTPLECLDEVVNPTEPEPPVEDENKPLPYCDTPEGEAAPACHDRQDFDDITKLYPCNDGTQKVDWRDCEDAYVPLPPVPSPSPKPCDPVTDKNCEPVDCPDTAEVVGGKCIPSKCKEGYKLVDGKCEKKDRHKHTEKDITIVINKIIKNTNDGHNHDTFPEIDIIGLSTKENGDSQVCLINIDKEQVQCQELGMANDRVNGDFWRVIETDHDKDYDNGNTGSNDIDGVIDDIKSQDFSELDDATNHDFGVELAWIAINPQGEGVTCLSHDSTGKGKSLCEPFKVSAEEISGQITEGVAIKNT